VCLVYNVQLTEFPSNKWVALTRAGWCVVCVVDYQASSINFVVFHKVVRRHYSGEVSEFIMFWRQISSPKIIKISPFLPSYSKYKGGWAFLRRCSSLYAFAINDDSADTLSSAFPFLKFLDPPLIAVTHGIVMSLQSTFAKHTSDDRCVQNSMNPADNSARTTPFPAIVDTIYTQPLRWRGVIIGGQWSDRYTACTN